MVDYVGIFLIDCIMQFIVGLRYLNRICRKCSLQFYILGYYAEICHGQYNKYNNDDNKFIAKAY